MYMVYKVEDLIHSEYRWNQMDINNYYHYEYCYMFHCFDRVDACHTDYWRYYNWDRCLWNRCIFLEGRTILMVELKNGEEVVERKVWKERTWSLHRRCRLSCWHGKCSDWRVIYRIKRMLHFMATILNNLLYYY
jgi:hypothetical protein